MAGVNYLTVYKLLEEIERHPCYEPKGDKGMSALYCYEILNRKGEYEVNAETWEEILKKLEAPKTLRKQVTLGDLPEELRSKIMEYKGDLSRIHKEMRKVRENLCYPVSREDIEVIDRLNVKNDKYKEMMMSDIERQRDSLLKEKRFRCWKWTLYGEIMSYMSWKSILGRKHGKKLTDNECQDKLRWSGVDYNELFTGREHLSNPIALISIRYTTQGKLKLMCEERGLKVSGNKKDLIKRLMMAYCEDSEGPL